MEPPSSFKWLTDQGFNGIIPWYLIDPQSKVAEGLRQEYQLETNLDILPFARRQDNDDIAGFEVVNNQVQPTVLTVHLTWTSRLEKEGFPGTMRSSDIFEWLKEVMLPDAKGWVEEEGE